MLIIKRAMSCYDNKYNIYVCNTYMNIQFVFPGSRYTSLKV